MEYFLDGELIGKSDMYIKEDIDRLSIFDIFVIIISRAVLGKS